jgi:hypothetical protein
MIGLALIFIVGKIVLEQRLAHLDAAGDLRDLGELAFARGCSTYDLFAQAGAVWHFSKTKIDADFKNYTHTDRIPTYLHDFLMHEGPPSEKTYQELLYAGGRPPYL